MKQGRKKVAAFLAKIFGWVIMICLFAGGLLAVGYVIAFIVGGEAAAAICAFLYEKIVPVLVHAATVSVIFGLITMYVAGEVALVPDPEARKVHKKKKDETA